MFGRIVDGLIAVACVTIAVLMLSDRINRPSGRDLSPGEMLSVGSTMPDLPGVSFRQTERTLVIFTQRSCPFCEQSTPFWKRLLLEREQRHSALRIIAVSGDSVETTRQYFTQHDLSADGFVSVLLPVRATPALLLVDTTGVVRRNWIGRPPNAAAEDEIIRSVL
jgi:glutaredoxin